jgi:hypothetical protein
MKRQARLWNHLKYKSDAAAHFMLGKINSGNGAYQEAINNANRNHAG